ncbi:MAG: chromate efflux transporter [Gammaproteobacteria bacterium]
MTYSGQTEKAESGGGAVEVFRVFLGLGLTSFGGPVAHIGYFRRALVEQRQWIDERRFSELLAMAHFLPGPASSQLGFALGLHRAGWGGGLAAFLAFTLPSVFLLLAFALVLPGLPELMGQGLIQGLKLVAVAVVADAVLAMSSKLCPDTRRRSIALLAAAILLLAGDVWVQLLVVLGGAVAGVMLLNEAAPDSQVGVRSGFGRRTAALVLGLFAVLLFGLPVVVSLTTAGGGEHGFGETLALAERFYRAGALVFGGGHVVLPLLEESMVGPGGVSAEQFLAGYGAAQAVPGPMFAFSAYLGLLSETGGGPSGAAVALLAMFLPGMMLIAAALPLWSGIARRPGAANGIAGVGAAVVGLLGVALYDPVFTSAVHDGADLAIALIGFGLLRVWRLPVVWVVAWCVVASWLSLGLRIPF